MKKKLPLNSGLLALFMLLTLFCSNAYAQSYDAIVAQDGTGNHTTIRAALAAAPSNRTTPYRIFIKNGKYREKDTLTKPFIHLIGESVTNVIVSWDDFNGKPIPGGGGSTYGTGNSATFLVNAADFMAMNITFENTTGESPQALAISVNAERAAFKNCRFLGGQDTVYAGGTTSGIGNRQYFRNCYIDGTVDFIFGDARAVFDSCVIYGKTRASSGNSWITAANTKPAEQYGYVFRDCQIPPNRGGTSYFLGRPWQNDATQQTSENKTIFLNTTMSSAVNPAGWATWNDGTDVNKITYAEYRSRRYDSSLIGSGQRVPWSKQLTASEAANYYNNTNLFGSWNPCAVSPDFCASSTPIIAVSNFRGVKGTNTSTFSWNISWPVGGVKYEILRSSDRTAFTKVSEQTGGVDSMVNFSFTETIPPPGVTWYYLIQASKAGHNTHITDTVVISSTPTITTSGAMGSFIQGVGTPSNPQSYTVSGASLTNNLIITAPTGYEISANNGTTWNNSSNPLVLTPTNGNVANTPISVRLNATTAGTYSGDIIHASAGADTVRLAVTGTVQSDPLTVSQLLQWWTMTTSNADSAAVRAAGVMASTPTFSRFVLSDGSLSTVPAYSPNHGQAFAPQANGSFAAPTGPGGTLNRTFYEQFTVTAASTHSLRVDSLILTTSIHNSANGVFAVVFSKTAFVSDSTNLPGASFTAPITLANETAGNTTNLRFAFAGGTGIALASNETLTFRLYYAVGSGSTGRYAKLKNVQIKGLATANPAAGEYRTKQSGNWMDVNTWERYNGTQWVHPAPDYPHFGNAGGTGQTTTILSGHTVTYATTIPNTVGSGYVGRRTRINNGGQLIVSNGATILVPNDGTPSTASIDLQVDGIFSLSGTIGTNGNVAVLVNGTFINSSTGMNLNNGGDTTIVGSAGTYQHNINDITRIPGNTSNAFIFRQGATFLATGLTTAGSGLFRSGVKYSNIVWNNTGQTSSHALGAGLDSSNVLGSFTVQSTGSSNLTFNQVSGRKVFPGGYYQTGGLVNFREGGTGTDTLDLGGDFSVTGGTFNSNATGASSLLVRLNGISKSINYNQSGATNTNWVVNGSYNLTSNLALGTAGFGATVNGTLNAGMNAFTGIGNFALAGGAFFTTASSSGLDAAITTTGNKTLSPTANFTYNGTTPEVTGTLLPATVNTLTISNPANVTLNGGNLSVTASLTLGSGKLLVGSNNITASSVLSSNSDRYVVTNGNGALRLRNVATGITVFPVGPTVTSYNPVTLNNAGASDNYSVSVKTTFDQPVPDANRVVNRQWMINEDVAGGSNATVTLAWMAADQAAGFDPAGSISIIRFNGNSWEAYPASISGLGTVASPYVATATGITAFSPFTVINNVALPLNLVSFNAAYKNKQVNLTWSTTSEVNTKEFQVERSAEGRIFNSIGTIKASNTAGNHSYTLTDAAPLTGINYYRIKTIDISGAFTYSKVAAINTANPGKITILSNPVRNQLIITHPAATATASFAIVSLEGKVLMHRNIQKDATQLNMNVSGLATGSYVLVFQNGNTKSTVTFLKK